MYSTTCVGFVTPLTQVCSDIKTSAQDQVVNKNANYISRLIVCKKVRQLYLYFLHHRH